MTLAQCKKLLIVVAILIVTVLFSTVIPKVVATDTVNQNGGPVLDVGLIPLPQNGLTKLVNTWYANLDINISVTFSNVGNRTPIEGRLRLLVSVPSKTWITWTDYLIPQLGPGGSYSSFLYFTPREDGLYTISVDPNRTNTNIGATIQGGYLPLNVAPSSAYTTLVAEVATVLIAAFGVIVGFSRRGGGGGGRGRR
jgi:hypothetical protein